MQMNSSNLLSAHRDVLDPPIPDNPEEQKKLADELQRRGKGAVAAGQWQDAKLLYEKALQIDETNAIWHSNLALVLGKMNQWDMSLESAQKATHMDGKYVKGWWRLGQAYTALEQYKLAITALQKGQALDPTNKALDKELKKLQEKSEKQQQKGKDKKPTSTAKTTTSAVKVTSSSSSTSKKLTTSTTSKNSGAEPMDVDDGNNNNVFSKSDHVRGYKIVNGKKTSYFHKELSEEDKKLIGDIAPKKLEDSESNAATQPPSSTDNNTTTTTSAWNKAGTWEEKDCTLWAKETFTQQLQTAIFALPKSNNNAALLKVDKVDVANSSHASIAAVRGKKRYLYELNVTVHWKLVNDKDEEETIAKGTLQFPDIDGTCSLGDPYEIGKFDISSIDDDDSDSTNWRPLLVQYCQKGGLRKVLHGKIDDWVRLFQETY